MEKADPYGEWALRKIQRETAGNPGPLPEEVIAAARAAWPRVVAHAARELEREGSKREPRLPALNLPGEKVIHAPAGPVRVIARVFPVQELANKSMGHRSRFRLRETFELAS
jgi:hypothetical protein